MIFQVSIALDVDNREVYVVFDLDTGMIGFTEIYDGKTKEFSYQSGPSEFKIAFAKLMENLASKNHQSNSLICRKGRAAQVLYDFWSNETRKS